ncbi:MAG: hypothetical protein HYX68_19370 [Planctomycetes bacterium]|nr:hypothetical protein [Planctomycetota bacterium]
MVTSIFLVSCALTLAQGTDRADWQISPRLAPGLELVYRGTYSDETLIPNVQHQRKYRLDVNVLVLDSGIKDFQAAIMTTLSLQGAKQLNKKKDGPSSVRLEMIRVDSQGRARGGDKQLVEIPLKEPPTLETGFFLPAPKSKVGRNFTWDVRDAKLPIHRWLIVGMEASGGVTCIKVAGLQQSSDWDSPRADQTAWRRRDVLWIHPQLFIAQKVERTIERRDPARTTPTHRMVVRYELESRLQYPGLLFEDRRKALLNAAKFHDEARQLLKQPTVNRQKIDSLVQRVSFHLERQPPNQATPYRNAVVHIKAVLEKAQRGDLPARGGNDEPALPTNSGIRIGGRVPDFGVSGLTDDKVTRWRSGNGTATLVVFFNPGTALGKEVMTYARRLNTQHADRLTILALGVTQDADVAVKLHKTMRLPFPILDGSGLRVTFGAMQTPRFVLVDGDGLVRLAQTGWGYQTPYEIAEALQNCTRK